MNLGRDQRARLGRPGSRAFDRVDGQAETQTDPEQRLKTSGQP
jgi:hypothetical protein